MNPKTHLFVRAAIDSTAADDTGANPGDVKAEISLALQQRVEALGKTFDPGRIEWQLFVMPEECEAGVYRLED